MDLKAKKSHDGITGWTLFLNDEDDNPACKYCKKQIQLHHECFFNADWEIFLCSECMNLPSIGRFLELYHLPGERDSIWYRVTLEKKELDAEKSPAEIGL